MVKKKSLRGLMKEKDSLIEEYKRDLQRLQAEFENFRKRVEREKEEFVKFAKEELIIKLLDVVDNFERALKNIKDKGVEMIYKQFVDVLKKEGVEEIKVDKFDPNKHEVIGKKKGGKLVEVQKGYYLRGKVIRPSKVIIGGSKDG